MNLGSKVISFSRLYQCTVLTWENFREVDNDASLVILGSLDFASTEINLVSRCYN